MSSGSKENRHVLIARVNVADHRQVVGRSVPNTIGNNPQSRPLGRAANESRHGKGIGPKPNRVQRIGELLAGRVIGAGARALDDHRHPARIGLPRRGGDPLVHRHRIRLRRDHCRQRRTDVAKPRGEPCSISY